MPELKFAWFGEVPAIMLCYCICCNYFFVSLDRPPVTCADGSYVELWDCIWLFRLARAVLLLVLAMSSLWKLWLVCEAIWVLPPTWRSAVFWRFLPRTLELPCDFKALSSLLFWPRIFAVLGCWVWMLEFWCWIYARAPEGRWWAERWCMFIAPMFWPWWLEIWFWFPLYPFDDLGLWIFPLSWLPILLLDYLTVPLWF